MAIKVAVTRVAMLVNGLSSVAAWGVFLLLLPRAAAPAGVEVLADRLAWALRLSVWPAALLLAMTAGVMAARVVSVAFNPIDDAESRGYRISQRVLANSVEQTAIFLPAFLALAATLDPADLGVLPLVLGFFLAGRLLFWAGYLIHLYARAPGMAVTFNVNAGVVGYVIWRLLG